MPLDEYQKLKRQQDDAIKLVSLKREQTVANYYAERGKNVIGSDKERIREICHMPAGPVADLLIEMAPRELVIAEVKGGNLDKAVEQLQHTALHAPPQYLSVVCKIYAKNPTPPGDSVELRGGRFGFHAVRVFHAAYPGEWILYEYDGSGQTVPVMSGTNQVRIVFGPHI